MWAKTEEWAKAHPMALGVLIFVLGAVLVYLMTRGSTAPAQQGQDLTGYYQAQAQAAAAGNALAANQVAAQAAIAAAQLQLQEVETQAGAAVQIATLQGKTSTDIAGLEAQVATTQQQSDLALGTLQSTLSAQVTQAGYTRDTTIATLNAGAATDAAQIAANAAVSEAALSAHTSEAGFLAQIEQLRIQGATTLGVAGYEAGTAQYTAGQETARAQIAGATTLGVTAQQTSAAVEQSLIAAQTDLVNQAYAAYQSTGGTTTQFITPIGSGEVTRGEAVASIPTINVFQPNFYPQAA